MELHWILVTPYQRLGQMFIGHCPVTCAIVLNLPLAEGWLELYQYPCSTMPVNSGLLSATSHLCVGL